MKNPIIRGFYPDPSICEAGGKYYLACSSFQYFPGVPLFESEDLVHFTQTGNIITRTSQCDLTEVPSSGGIFAPTLRYHDGRFYMVTNDNTSGRNFYLYTDNINGEWSDPVYVDQDGIDPSLLFDGDKVYFISNGTDADGKKCINQCQIDIATGRKLTESVPVWHGNGGRYLESPHMYHIGKYYYLFAAEGGTEYGHMEVYARSENPYGPFENFSGNPIITNRNLGGDESLIQGIGHADLTEKDGHYYLVCLGFRQISKWEAYHNLGREVFITEINLTEDGWFRHTGDGAVREKLPESLCPGTDEPDMDADFKENPLDDPRWISLRRPSDADFEDGVLILYTDNKDTLADICPAFFGLRQSEMNISFKVTVNRGRAHEAGVTVYMSEDCHYDLFLCDEEMLGNQVGLRITTGDADSEYYYDDYDGDVTLEIESDAEEYRFIYTVNGERNLISAARTKFVSTEVAGGFTGVVIGLYATGENNGWAEFRELDFKQNSK